MNMLQTFIVGIGAVILLVGLVVTWWFVSRKNNIKLPNWTANRRSVIVTGLGLAILSLTWIFWDKIPKPSSLMALVLTVVAVGVYGKGWLDHRGKPSVGAQFAYKKTIGVLFICALTLFFFGERFLSDPLANERFDIRSGTPNYMVYEVEGGVKIGNENNGILLSRKRLHPDDCRQDGVPHVGFDYAKYGTCLSEVDGSRMRPIRTDDVIIQSSVRSGLSGIWSLIWGPSTTQAEVETKQKQVLLGSQLPNVACVGEYASLTDCRVYTMSAGTQATFMKKFESGWCQTWPEEGLTKVYDGSRNVLLEAQTDISFPLWHLRKGETAFGYTCPR